MVLDSSTGLLAAVEDLFYVLHARLKTEITNIELCESFHFDSRSRRAGQNFYVNNCLPESEHLKLIFQACYKLLRTPEIRDRLNTEVIRQQQADYVHQTIKNAAAAGYHPENTAAYRQRILDSVCDPSSRSYKKWKGLNPVYDAAPGMMLATLSEKLRWSMQGDKVTAVGADKFEGKQDNDTREQFHEEKRHIMAHREAAYAMLHGTSVGEYRRQEGQQNLYQYLREKLCVCFGFCPCSKRCTERSHRVCPCNARIGMQCGIDTISLRQCFGERCSDGAAVIFEQLSDATRSTSGSELLEVLTTGINAFPQEVVSYRELYEQLDFSH